MAHYHTIISKASGGSYYGAYLLIDQEKLLLAKIKGIDILPKKITKSKNVLEVCTTEKSSRTIIVYKRLVWKLGHRLSSGDCITGAVSTYYHYSVLMRDEFERMLTVNGIKGVSI